MLRLKIYRYPNQSAAIIAGIVGKTFAAYCLWNGYQAGIFSEVALLIGVSDGLLALAYIYVLLSRKSEGGMVSRR